MYIRTENMHRVQS